VPNGLIFGNKSPKRYVERGDLIKKETGKRGVNRNPGGPPRNFYSMSGLAAGEAKDSWGRGEVFRERGRKGKTRKGPKITNKWADKCSFLKNYGENYRRSLGEEKETTGTLTEKKKPSLREF